MKLEKRKPSGREKNQQAIELLEQLREKLFCEDISAARRAAFKLSWMQEDGFDILKEAMFGNFSRTTKTAAAYGLRRMQGRMKRMALELLRQGLKHRDNTTRNVCEKALSIIAKRTAGQPIKEKRHPVNKIEIKEISGKGAKKGSIYKKGKEQRLSSFER